MLKKSLRVSFISLFTNLRISFAALADPLKLRFENGIKKSAQVNLALLFLTIYS